MGGWTRTVPEYIGHGTCIAAGVSIMMDGMFVPAPSGTIGSGMYGFAADKGGAADVKEWLTPIWKRGAAGGYTQTALVIVKACGAVPIKRVPKKTLVPAGCVCAEGDQLALNPEVVEFVSITFCVKSLMHYLKEQLDAIGYTETLHYAILEAQRVLSENPVYSTTSQNQKRKMDTAAKPPDKKGKKFYRWNGAWFTTFAGSEGRWLKDEKEGWFVLHKADPPISSPPRSSGILDVE